MIKVFKKGENVRLSENLMLHEVDCKCTDPRCTLTIIDEESVKSFQDVRDTTGQPIDINSGHRCMVHNDNSDGVPHSQHKVFALDLRCPEGYDFDRFYKICSNSFEFTLAYPQENFVHCDNRLII